MMSAYRIELLRSHEWERLRRIRLQALADAPDAFGSRWADEEIFGEEIWKGRLENPSADTFVAVREGLDVGLVTVAPYGATVGLFSMWVAPEMRGKRVGESLIDAVVGWVRDQDFAKVLLDVADENHSAIALYERKNFLPTGVSGSLSAPRAHVREHQRALILSRLSEADGIKAQNVRDPVHRPSPRERRCH